MISPDVSCTSPEVSVSVEVEKIVYHRSGSSPNPLSRKPSLFTATVTSPTVTPKQVINSGKFLPAVPPVVAAEVSTRKSAPVPLCPSSDDDYDLPKTCVSVTINPLLQRALSTSQLQDTDRLTPEHTKVDLANDARLQFPFATYSDDSMDIPDVCTDEGDNLSENRQWSPGKPIRVAYVTWNMANRSPSAKQVSQCIRPNAHIIVVGTQENGPYVGLNTSQENWEKLVECSCLKNQYTKVGSNRLWALHIVVFARKRDVAKYVTHCHFSKVACGLLGVAGNKGAVACAFSLKLNRSEKSFSLLERRNNAVRTNQSLSKMVESFFSDETREPTPKSSPRFRHSSISTSTEESMVVDNPPLTLTSERDELSAVEDLTSVGASSPPFLTFLCVNAHFPAHQEAVKERNECYAKVIRSLKVGLKGKFRKHHWSPVSENSKEKTSLSDVSDDFDVILFGGDLNYRINGTRAAITRIAGSSSMRSVLSMNDQLRVEKEKGNIFQGFDEGKLCFRPTYKYVISASNEVASSSYKIAASEKKSRMPAYCDRVLFKCGSHSRARKIDLSLYTDVPSVTTSDHKPVVALFDITTPYC